MYLKIASTPLVEAAIEKINKFNLELQNKIQIEPNVHLFERGTDLVLNARNDASLYLLISGEVELSVSGKTILYYEAGDLVGLESLMSTECKIVAKNFAVEVSKIPLRVIEEQTDYDSLVSLVANLAALFLSAFAGSTPEEENFEPEIVRYESGQVIVEQGTFGDDIFTLIDGHADVFVEGKKVGEVKSDEIFGALAAMTNIGRTATIKASEDCLVMSIKKNRLIELIKLRPSTVEKLISDLARVIQDQNMKLSNLT